MKINYVASTLFLGTVVGAIYTTITLINSIPTGGAPADIVLAIIVGIYSFWGVCVWAGSAMCHLDEVSTVEAAAEKISAAESALTEIKGLAAEGATGLPDQLLALKQEDNPVTKYMGLVTSGITSVRNEKERLAIFKAKIKARAAGPLGLIVATFGSGPTE